MDTAHYKSFMEGTVFPPAAHRELHADMLLIVES